MAAVPLFPLPNVVLFPRAVLPLHIFEERYKTMTADALAEKLPRRSLVCVFSDFFDERQDALKRILALRARKHDVAIFHLVDKAELEFPYDDPTLFQSMEDGKRIEVNPREIKESYLEEFGAFLVSEDARWGAIVKSSGLRIE